MDPAKLSVVAEQLEVLNVRYGEHRTAGQGRQEPFTLDCKRPEAVLRAHPRSTLPQRLGADMAPASRQAQNIKVVRRDSTQTLSVLDSAPSHGDVSQTGTEMLFFAHRAIAAGGENGCPAQIVGRNVFQEYGHRTAAGPLNPRQTTNHRGCLVRFPLPSVARTLGLVLGALIWCAAHQADAAKVLSAPSGILKGGSRLKAAAPGDVVVSGTDDDGGG